MFLTKGILISLQVVIFDRRNFVDDKRRPKIVHISISDRHVNESRYIYS